MAEEKKMSKGQRRYAHGNKIMDKKKPGEPKAEAKEKSSEGGDGKMMGKDAQGTPTADVHMDRDNPGSAPKADVTSGTDGITIQDRHSGERDEMTKRHTKEMHQMHMRHASEHEAMIKKHAGDMHSSDITEGEAMAGGTATAGQ